MEVLSTESHGDLDLKKASWFFLGFVHDTDPTQVAFKESETTTYSESVSEIEYFMKTLPITPLEFCPVKIQASREREKKVLWMEIKNLTYM